MLKTVITVIQIIIAIFLMTSILIQAKGVGLSGTFGGEGTFYRSKRGVEKLLLYLTIFLAFVFFVISIINVMI